ncbi:MAG TPA: hypothetical protein VNR65_13980 [Geobacterales bacterium]|nr:hypothetical protein [Geobacterales bacterium]
MSGRNSHDWDARASDALAEALAMPKGADRSDALKKAGRLRVAADMQQNLRSQTVGRSGRNAP